MEQKVPRQSRSAAELRAEAALDIGLRSYLSRVYNYMASGLMLSALTATLTVRWLLGMTVEQIVAFFNSGTFTLVSFSPLAIILAMSFMKMSASTTQIMYWIFVSLMGVSLSSIFFVYQLGSIVRIFFITAAAFSALSLYGYTTQRNLTGMGSFLVMALFGLIIATLVNIFLASSGLDFLLSIAGVLIFAGLTAYDTQRIKLDYLQMRRLGGAGSELEAKSAIHGALKIYLDFINLFLFLLRLFGRRR